MFNKLNQLTTLFAGAVLCGSFAVAQDSAHSAEDQKAAVPKAEKATAADVKSSGVVVFVDPVTHQIRPAERGEVNTLTSPKGALKPATNVKTAAMPKIAATSRVITGLGGSQGVVLGQDMMQFMVVTKDSAGTLKEECVQGAANANQAMKPAPAAKTTAQKQTPGELDVQ